jgi:hypothetical protein
MQDISAPCDSASSIARMGTPHFATVVIDQNMSIVRDDFVFFNVGIKCGRLMKPNRPCIALFLSVCVAQSLLKQCFHSPAHFFPIRRSREKGV